MGSKKEVIIDDVRHILGKFTPETERFTSMDVAKSLPKKKHHKLSCAMRQLENFGEIVKVGKAVGESGGRRHLLNVYIRATIAVRLRTIDETNALDPWFEVWPEMYKVPAHIIAAKRSKWVHIQK